MRGMAEYREGSGVGQIEDRCKMKAECLQDGQSQGLGMSFETQRI